MFDIVVIGAGVTGCMIARELSKYKLSIAVLEKCNDVGNKTSNANSAIIHSGYDPEPGTNKAKFNVLGNPMYDQIAKDLDVNFMRIGSLTIALEDEQLPTLQKLAERSKANGVEVKILNAKETIEIEPNINPNVKGSLFAPTAGIIDPFVLTVRCMENAVDNGAKLFRSTEVLEIKKVENYYKIITNCGVFESKIVINAAGNYADHIASMVEDIDWEIIPKKGQYFVLDHFAWFYVKHTIFPLPSEKGKGVLVSSTTSGNYLIGPSSDLVDDKEDYSTNKKTLAQIKRQALTLVPTIPMQEAIRTFSGLRPSCSRHDFIIEYSKNDKHFINVAGIESPGLASAPAIAEYVVNDLVKPIMNLEANPNYNPVVRKHNRLLYAMIHDNPSEIGDDKDFNEIICSCEKVTLGEIKDELTRSVPPVSVKGLKRRTRAGFGKCQGGFCQPKVLLLLAEAMGVSPLDVPLDEEGSYILSHKVKEPK